MASGWTCRHNRAMETSHHGLLPIDESSAMYGRVALAIRHLREHARRQPDLAEVAAAMGLSEAHAQRVFSAWAGISPKRFLQVLSRDHALAALRCGDDLLAAADAGGLSGPGRLHDLMVVCEAMTPGEIRSQGAGVNLHWGLGPTPFGVALVAWTVRGVCQLSFLDQGANASQDEEAQSAGLRADWPQALLVRDVEGARKLLERIFTPMQAQGAREPLRLILRGSNFQVKVWEALLRVPLGQRLSYGQLATMAGVPRAQRAVGSAMAANCIAYLIPCHRVIRESGDSGQYRWQPERKVAMLAWEAARCVYTATPEGAGVPHS